jgi:predicted AAA+ superfamily ATPase
MRSLTKAINAIDQVRESLLTAFVKNPEKLHHLLLVGPPGCGKTTTARRIIENFYTDPATGIKSLPPGSALFLNASDERGLDSIRAKIYPFIQCKPILPSKGPSPPRFIVLDEAETLTESAQLALRPVFETPAQEVCLIFIVNNISGIHQSLRHRFLRLQFMPPSVKTLEARISGIQNKDLKVPKILDAFRWRGDLRHFLLQPTDHSVLTEFTYDWLNEPKQPTPLRKSNLDSAEDLISFGYLLKILDLTTIKELLNITDPALTRVSPVAEQRNRLEAVVKSYRKKLEDLTPF